MAAIQSLNINVIHLDHVYLMIVNFFTVVLTDRTYLKACGDKMVSKQYYSKK